MKRDRLRACDLKIVYISVSVEILSEFYFFFYSQAFRIRFNKILIKCITIIISPMVIQLKIFVPSLDLLLLPFCYCFGTIYFARCKLKTTLNSKRRAKTIKALTCKNISPSERLCSNAFNSLLRYASWWCMCDNNPFSSFSLCITTAHQTQAQAVTHTNPIVWRRA